MDETDSTRNHVLDTAVIPLAGLGTRIYPYAAEMPKFMAPVLSGDQAVPNIDYTLNDLLGAGIKNFVFVVSRDNQQALIRYLGPIDLEVKHALERLGKHDLLEAEITRRERFAAQDIQVEFVHQDLTGKYGTTVPLQLSKHVLAGVKHFTVYGGDDFIYHADSTSELKLLIEGWRQSGLPHAVLGAPVPRAAASKYGILQTQDGKLVQIDEKPPLERISDETPLANISRYIHSDAIWPFVEEQMQKELPEGRTEYFVTDVIDAVIAAGYDYHAQAITGTYLDAGTAPNLRAAGLAIDSLNA